MDTGLRRFHAGRKWRHLEKPEDRRPHGKMHYLPCGWIKTPAWEFSRAGLLTRPHAMVSTYIYTSSARPWPIYSSVFFLLNLHKLGGKVVDLKSLIGIHKKGCNACSPTFASIVVNFYRCNAKKFALL